MVNAPEGEGEGGHDGGEHLNRKLVTVSAGMEHTIPRKSKTKSYP